MVMILISFLAGMILATVLMGFLRNSGIGISAKRRMLRTQKGRLDSWLH